MMDFFIWLEGTALSTWVREADTVWAYPTVLTMHTFGLALLVGASGLFALRLLGVASRMPLHALRPLFMVMWAGFWLNAVTGSLLFMADASRRAFSVLFLTKLLFVAIGVVSIVLVRRDVFATGPEPVISSKARMLALVSLAVWVVAITTGRLLAYV
jgi:hypothetical protein